MEVYQGKSVFGGIAIGRISVHKKDEQQVKRVRIEDSEQEILRYRQAKQTAMEQLQGLYQKALKEVGEANAAIFEIHQMMLEDDDYNESVENIIRMQQVNAEYAVASTGDNFAQMFSAMDDDYMRARSADVKDISERVLSVLGGRATGIDASGEPVIIVADDLAPSETVQLNKDLVLSFVTVHGSVNSHTAILARTMSIPALIGTAIPLTDDIDGKVGIVDGKNGCIYVDPDEDTLGRMQQLKLEEQEKKELLQTLKERENITIDGKKIMLYANIGNSKDLAAVLQNDAGGIGLFRSEFIYLERDTFPTEEEQFQIYRTVAETMAGKPVIIRTLDIGADKKCDYFEMEPEENPAMGCRAIRICLTRPEIFKTQLRALFRASAFGNISIMYPMIISVDELRKINKKIYDSLFILFDLKYTDKKGKVVDAISYTREKMTYILVYNEQNYLEYGPTKQTNQGEDRQRVSQSHHRDLLYKSMRKLAQEEFILFGLDQFQNYLFKHVYTFTEKEFEQNFVNKRKENNI